MSLTFLPTKTATAGFTLLEVMIALVIFSIGLLGLAGLQARGLQSNTVAQYRTMAVIQAYDMAERIRANPQGVANNDYDALDAAAGIAPAPNCVTASCNPDELAAHDYYEWQVSNAATMPSGYGTVQRLGSQFSITVRWDEARTNPSTKNCSTMKCYILVFEP